MKSEEMFKFYMDEMLFQVDLDKKQIVGYDNPNIIPFENLSTGPVYSFVQLGTVKWEQKSNPDDSSTDFKLPKRIIPSPILSGYFEGEPEMTKHFNSISKRNQWNTFLLTRTESARIDGILPEIKIGNTTFKVDVMNAALIDTSHPRNVIFFNEMQDKESCYEFTYNTSIQNLPTSWSDPTKDISVKIPQMVELDRIGIAEKFNLNPWDIPKKDVELACDPGLLEYRLTAAFLPRIAIDKDEFVVDLASNTLIMAKDRNTRLNIRHMDEDDDNLFYYQFYYHQPSKTIVSISEMSTMLPKDVVQVKIPHRNMLDPVIAAREHRISIKEFVNTYPIQKKLKAEVIPLWKTDIAKVIRENSKKGRRTGSRAKLKSSF